MQVALSLARRGLGQTWPNPAVGAVLVKQGRLLSTGHTQPGGRPHAEVVALQKIGTAAKGATAYVTLEPCAHTGKTPPCVDALVSAGVARVVTAMQDPDPRTAGMGHTNLRAAGISVTEAVGQAAAEKVNAGFVSRITRGRPIVTLKLANTLDGRIATQTGESRWITGPLARRLVHHMRMTHDAVLVGSGTARADDPALDIRGFGKVAPPLRLILDRNMDLPKSHRLFSDGAPTWRITGPSSGASETVLPVPVTPNGQIDLTAAMQALGNKGLTRILCEGGGTLAASLLAAGLVDRIALFTAGKCIGGDGIPSVGTLNLSALSSAPSFTLKSARPIGNDTVSFWEPE